MKGGHATDRANVAEPAPSVPSAWWAVLVFVVASIVSYIDRVALSLLIDPIRTEMVLSEVQMGLLQGTAFALLYAVAGLPLGRLADRRSRRNLLVLGVVLWSVATALGGLAPNFEWLFLSRILVGIGEASLVPAALSMIADLHPPARRGRAVTAFMLGQSIGGGLSIAFVGYIIGQVAAGAFTPLPWIGATSAWRAVLVLCGLLGIGVVALLLTLREPPRTDLLVRADGRESEHRRALPYIVQRADLLVPLYVGYAFLTMGTYGLVAWTPTLLMRRHELSPSEAAYLFGSVTAGCQFAGVLAGGALLGWLQRRGLGHWKLSACAWGALACLPAVLVGIAPSGAFAAAALAFWFMAASAAGTILVTANLEFYPGDLRGTAVALNSLCSTLVGASLGPLVIAWMTERVLGNPKAIDVSVALVLAASVLVSFVLLLRSARVLRSRLAHDAVIRAVMNPGASGPAAATAPRAADDAACPLPAAAPTIPAGDRR